MRMVKNIGIILILLVNVSYAQSTTDYLILQDVGDYMFKTQAKDFITGQTRTVPGYSMRIAPGILAGADHFDVDHDDKTYETKYVNRTIGFGIEVQVTKHTNSDSDKWLLHEVDAEFRNYYGIPDGSFIIKPIDGNIIFAFGSGGWDFRWLSGTKVIMIEYTDLQMSKPQPLDVVKAYLTKHPSTLPPMTLTQLRSADSKVKWIKDEMDRRLWLCDKWFMQLQLGKVQQNEVFQQAVKSMKIFLDYREKYFGLKAADEKNLLASYLNTNNGSSIKAKLTEYKNWWVVHKSDTISIQ